jgi:hypothetical protein
MKTKTLITIVLCSLLIVNSSAQTIKSNQFRMNNVLISNDIADNKPPLLELTEIAFTDANGNNRVDAFEQCNISFTIANKGKGNANNLKVLLQNSGLISGLVFEKTTLIGKIEPGKIQKVSIPISSDVNLTTGKANFQISFEEDKGFPPDAFELNIDTREFSKPDVRVVDQSFLTDNGNIKLGYPIQLKVLVQNVDQGIAENVNVSFLYPAVNVFPNDNSEFSLGILQPGDSKELVFEFQANKKYTEKTIPITVKITEKYGKYAQNKNVAATLDARSAGTTITIASSASDNTFEIQTASLTADVDKNIPQIEIKYPNRYALIIGNEDYTSRQDGLSTEINVAFAANDARIFKEYAVNTLGVEERNVFLLINATAGEMSQKIELVCQILSRLGESAELIFYYAGHGFPDENTKIPYLIPVDVSATNLSSAIKLNNVYSKFAATNAKRVTIFLDACFTGGGREAGLLAARSVKVKPKNEILSGNMVVFAATSEDQSALPYKAKQHGMFSYFLFKKLQETKGDVTYGDLEKYLRDKVSIESLRINSKAQDPKASVSYDAENVWENWKIR